MVWIADATTETEPPLLRPAKFSNLQVSQSGFGPKINQISIRLWGLMQINLAWTLQNKHPDARAALLNDVTRSYPPTEVSPLYSQPNRSPHGSFQAIETLQGYHKLRFELY